MVLFQRDTGRTCFVPALSRACCVFVAAHAAARLFSGVNLNVAKTGQDSMSHPCISLPDLVGMGDSIGRGWDAGQVEVGKPTANFSLYSLLLFLRSC